jgi:hypothetical protein
MQYIYIRDGKVETVDEEVWQWEAHYQDGSTLYQFEKPKAAIDKGVYHQFGEIDQSKLVAFKMFSETNSAVYVIPFDGKEMKLIHFYINSGINLGTPDFKKLRWYVFGYESKGVKHLNIITDNGEVIMCEDPSILQI